MYVQSETKHGSVFTCSITRLFRVRPEVARQRSYVTSLVYRSVSIFVQFCVCDGCDVHLSKSPLQSVCFCVSS